MGLNETPSANRVHIGIFGRRNAGKSSVINAITGQNLAIVSDIKGTTTDPVYKSMELLPLGPVVIIDTPGLDDEGELGELRVKKANQVLNRTDIAILVVDAALGITKVDRDIIEKFEQKNIAYIIVMNKSDIVQANVYSLENIIASKEDISKKISDHIIWISTKTGKNIHELKELIARQFPKDESKYPIIADLINPLDFVVLVIPIDSAAPKGRLILPQQQTIREILENGAVSVVVRETELKAVLEKLGEKIKLVVTDSQAFKKVSKDTPDNILLTSFSILFARHKGNLETLVRGVRQIDCLENGDKVLICEGCTHHRQCDDIGTVKIPRWLSQYTGKELELVYTSGTEFPLDLSLYKLIIHCGGCMLNEREMKYRIKCAREQEIYITNYGLAIAYMNGILKRSLKVFPEIAAILK